jgi:cytochrome c553
MSKMQILAALVLAAGLPAFAASGDAEAGRKKSTPCKACHGENGLGVSPEFPTIAGQPQDYLATALNHYKAGKRKNPIMTGQVANLTPKDIQDLAAYFASLPSPLKHKY